MTATIKKKRGRPRKNPEPLMFTEASDFDTTQKTITFTKEELATILRYARFMAND